MMISMSPSFRLHLERDLGKSSDRASHRAEMDRCLRPALTRPPRPSVIAEQDDRRPARASAEQAGRQVGFLGRGREPAPDNLDDGSSSFMPASPPSGPKVSGRLAPISTPVQPLSLREAVTIATQGTSRSNCAK